MRLNTYAKLTLLALTFSLAGCSSSPKPASDGDTPGANHAASPQDDIQLVGITDIDEPIPAHNVDLFAQGLSCPLCAHNLDKQLLKVQGVASAEVDLSTGAAKVGFADGARVTPRQLIDAVEASGFTLTKIQAEGGEHESH